MKGDFTRCRFDTKKHYRSVRMQQGRVLLDSDWNNQMEIESHLSRAGSSDIVGICGGALENAGFALISDKEDIEKCKDACILENDGSLGDKLDSLPAGDILITRGRYYVDGILCENDEHVFGSEQKDLRKPLELEDGKDYLIYLDVWERHITSIEDPDIREVALGGPDTTTRVKTVWQVKAKELDEQSRDLDCKDRSSWRPAEPNGKLSVSLAGPGTGDGKCKAEAVSNYTGQDNHLYRVEIHRGGIVHKDGIKQTGTVGAETEPPERGIVEIGQGEEPECATFKWSRDNGSAVFLVKSILEGSRLRIGIGRDPISILKAGDWVEILGDETELKGDSGKLVKIKDIDESELMVTLDGDVGQFQNDGHIKIRKWDGGYASRCDREITAGSPFELEEGIVVVFSGDDFRAGDFWTFTARAITGCVETFDNMPPQGVVHHYCPLAKMSCREGKARLKEDCRSIFLSLTELTDLVNQILQRTELSYVGGSGQEGRRGRALRHPLLVGVSSLDGPVPHAWVRFEVKEGGGHIGVMGGEDNSENFLDVETDGDGVAGCSWKLGDEGCQRVSAALRDKKDLPVLFHADFLTDPDHRLRMEVSQWGMIVALVGILGCLIGMMHVAMRWFALSLMIAFAVMLVISFLIKKGEWRR